MTTRSYAFGLAALICLGVIFSASSPAAENDANSPVSDPNAAIKSMPKIIVMVNGIDITQQQVDVEIAPQLEQMVKQLPAQFVEQYKKQLEAQVVDKMVVELLLDEKVAKDKINITEEEITKHITQMAASQNPPLSMDEFKTLVEAYGKSFDEVKSRIKKGMGYQKLFEKQFNDKINVTEEEINAYYSENKSEFETAQQVRASHILIKLDTDDPNADPNQADVKAKAKIEGLLKQIKDGADFAELAKANSVCPSSAKGGDLNFFGKGQMVPEFEKAAFDLQPGQVSDVVKTQFGYHIIKVTDKKDANLISLEQAKRGISEDLKQAKQSELASDYIEILKAQADIVYPVKEAKKVDEPAIAEPNEAAK